MINIYEAIGGLVVIYMACVGIVAHGWLLWHGHKRISGRLDIGQLEEDAAVREWIAGPPPFPKDRNAHIGARG